MNSHEINRDEKKNYESYWHHWRLLLSNCSTQEYSIGFCHSLFAAFLISRIEFVHNRHHRNSEKQNDTDEKYTSARIGDVRDQRTREIWACMSAGRRNAHVRTRGQYTSSCRGSCKRKCPWDVAACYRVPEEWWWRPRDNIFISSPRDAHTVRGLTYARIRDDAHFTANRAPVLRGGITFHNYVMHCNARNWIPQKHTFLRNDNCS